MADMKKAYNDITIIKLYRRPYKQFGWSNDGRLESDVIFECVSLLLYPKDAINSLLASIKTSTQDHKAWKRNMVYKKWFQ